MFCLTLYKVSVLLHLEKVHICFFACVEQISNGIFYSRKLKGLFFLFFFELPPQCRDDVSMASFDPRRASTAIEKEPSE